MRRSGMKPEHCNGSPYGLQEAWIGWADDVWIIQKAVYGVIAEVAIKHKASASASKHWLNAYILVQLQLHPALWKTECRLLIHGCHLLQRSIQGLHQQDTIRQNRFDFLSSAKMSASASNRCREVLDVLGGRDVCELLQKDLFFSRSSKPKSHHQAIQNCRGWQCTICHPGLLLHVWDCLQQHLRTTLLKARLLNWFWELRPDLNPLKRRAPLPSFIVALCFTQRTLPPPSCCPTDVFHHRWAKMQPVTINCKGDAVAGKSGSSLFVFMPQGESCQVP